MVGGRQARKKRMRASIANEVLLDVAHLQVQSTAMEIEVSAL